MLFDGEPSLAPQWLKHGGTASLFHHRTAGEQQQTTPTKERDNENRGHSRPQQQQEPSGIHLSVRERPVQERDQRPGFSRDSQHLFPRGKGTDDYRDHRGTSFSIARQSHSAVRSSQALERDWDVPHGRQQASKSAASSQSSSSHFWTGNVSAGAAHAPWAFKQSSSSHKSTSPDQPLRSALLSDSPLLSPTATPGNSSSTPATPAPSRPGAGQWKSKLAEAPAGAPALASAPSYPGDLLPPTKSKDDLLDSHASSYKVSAAPGTGTQANGLSPRQSLLSAEVSPPAVPDPPVPQRTVAQTSDRSPPPVLPPVLAAPKPVSEPPKPQGIWGSQIPGSGLLGGATGGGLASDAADAASKQAAERAQKARLEQMALQQSKQLVPVLASKAAKTVGSNGRGSIAKLAALVSEANVVRPAGRGAGAAVAAAAAAGAAAGTSAASSASPSAGMRTFTLTRKVPLQPAGKKASPAQASDALPVPVDQPVATATALLTCQSAHEAPPEATGPAPSTAASDAVKAALACSLQADSAAVMHGVGTGACHYPLPQSVAVGSLPAVDSPTRTFSAPEPLSDASSAFGFCGFGISEEEESFLRSLGWSAEDDEEAADGGGLTDEEIAAFKVAAQQWQANGGLWRTVSSPLAVPAAGQLAHTALRQPGHGNGLRPMMVAASYGSEAFATDTDSDAE